MSLYSLGAEAELLPLEWRSDSGRSTGCCDSRLCVGRQSDAQLARLLSSFLGWVRCTFWSDYMPKPSAVSLF